MGGGSYGGVIAGGIGATLGGIGDMISALNYKRPRLQPATGPELRLRQLAQDQLLAGGQQSLAGTALYNQYAPLLMGMLPGMHYVPGDSGDGGTSGGGGGGGPVQSYTDALQAQQNQRAKRQQLTALNAQIKGMKPGANRRGLRQQRKVLQQDIKKLPTASQLERQSYMAGTQPDQSMYDIRQSAPPADSLAAYRGLIDGMSGAPPASLLDLYHGAGG